MNELKPCPFCGSVNVHWNEDGWIECPDCHIFFESAFADADKNENIESWNRRVEQIELNDYCKRCSNNGDHDGECSNCVAASEVIKWKVPSHYKPKDWRKESK